jgi:hypothetical protein
MDLGAMKTFEKSQFVEHQTIKRQDAAKALEVIRTERLLIAHQYHIESIASCGAYTALIRLDCSSIMSVIGCMYVRICV